MHFPGGSVGGEFAWNIGDARHAGSVLRWGDSLKEGTQTTPVFLPGKSHGQGSLAGYSP